MAFKDLFKTKAERKAYAKGRKDQYNKEHPKLKWGIQTTSYVFNKDGSLSYKDVDVYSRNKFKTKKQALEALKHSRELEKYKKARILEAVKNKNVNIYSSHDSRYSDYKLVKINERQD
ncbi:MAG: hypothetical protein II980_05190 [Clostridia bacterium]|nr:hypothetical protein [Clostridia bacterium]